MAEIFKSVIISEDVVSLKPSLASVDLKFPVENTLIELEKIKELDKEELERIKDLAREEGYKSGFNQGLSDGLAQANMQVTEQVNALNGLLQSIHSAISENRLQLSTEIADIVFGIAQQFFIQQQQNKESIAHQIAQILTQLNDKQNIELSLHPHDLALLQQGQVTIDMGQCKNLRITPDTGLRLGGCIIKSEHGVFDASIERQIDNLKQVLLQIKQGEPRG